MSAMSRAGRRYVSIACGLLFVISISYLSNSISVCTKYKLYARDPPVADNGRLVTNISCLKLFEGDADELQKAKHFISRMPPPPTDETFKVPTDCSVLKRWGYKLHPGSEEERTFPLAFSILMYHDVHRMEFLLRLVYQPQNVYCLHVDKKASQIVHDNVKAIVRCFPNVFIAKDLVNVTYGGYSRLQADINCMADLVNEHSEWKYHINVASSVLPLRTNAEMVKIMKVYNGSNDIEGFAGGWLDSIRFPNISSFNPRNSVPPPPHKLRILKGSAYGVYSRTFAEFVIKDEKARDLLSWFKNTKYVYSPDEHYWASLHHLKYNPQLKTPGGYLGEPESKPWLASYTAWCDSNPCLGTWSAHCICLFGVGDLPTLASRKELFANKFDPGRDQMAMLCLQELYTNRSRTAGPMLDWLYYKDLPFTNNDNILQKGR